MASYHVYLLKASFHRSRVMSQTKCAAHPPIHPSAHPSARMGYDNTPST